VVERSPRETSGDVTMPDVATTTATTSIARELATGGAYTAWLVATIIGAVAGFLFRLVMKQNDKLVEAYKEEDNEVIATLASVTKTQQEQTGILSAILNILRSAK
jgi:hypothetical protein